jgi:hypothetical protein
MAKMAMAAAAWRERKLMAASAWRNNWRNGGNIESAGNGQLCEKRRLIEMAKYRNAVSVEAKTWHRNGEMA